MNKPDIRFNGFDEEWEEKNYKEVFDTSVSNNTFSRAELTSEKTSTKNVHYGDILIKYNSILSVKKDDFPFIPDNVKVDSKNFLKNGDIVFADTAEDETCGKAVEITDLENENVLAGLHTFVARPKLQFQEKYLGYFINSPAYHNQLVPYMQGTKVTSISKANVQKTSVKYPNKAEQTKIGELFSKIDTLITSTQKEYDKLVALKKSMLQKMFPKKGSQVPEIRFKGFTDEWVEKKLGDFCSISIGEFVIQTKQRKGAPYPVYNGGISNTGYYDEYNEEGCKVIISARGANAGFVNKCASNYWAGNSCYSLGVKDSSNWIFLYHILKQQQDDFIKSQQSANIPSVSKQQVFNTKVLMPNNREQEKIALYFNSLDNLISTQAKKIEKLKTIKNTLLGKMFV